MCPEDFHIWDEVLDSWAPVSFKTGWKLSEPGKCPDNLETVRQPQNSLKKCKYYLDIWVCQETMRSEVIELLAKLQYTALRFPVDLSSLRGQSRVHLGWGGG